MSKSEIQPHLRLVMPEIMFGLRSAYRTNGSKPIFNEYIVCVVLPLDRKSVV